MLRAAVLTGGASRRMGTPKADLLVDGATMAERVLAAAAAAGAGALAAVGRPVAGHPAVEHLVEDEPGAGPLGAVLAALRWAGGDEVLVLACDLLRPSAAAMARVVGALGADAGADVAVPVVADRPQWLHGAWRSGPATLGAVAAALDAGERSLHGAAERLVVQRLLVAPADAPAFADADRPEDLPGGAAGGGAAPGSG